MNTSQTSSIPFHDETNVSNELTNISFIDERARTFFEASQKKAEQTYKNRDALEELLRKIEEKLKGLPVLNDTLSYIPIMAAMIKDIIEKDYPELPLGSMCAIVIALIYFVTPNDIIPDDVPVIGHLDDAGILLISLALIKKDVDEYIEWRDKRNAN